MPNMFADDVVILVFAILFFPMPAGLITVVGILLRPIWRWAELKEIERRDAALQHAGYVIDSDGITRRSAFV